MDRDEAVRLALEAIQADDHAFIEPLSVRREERLMHPGGEERSGWVVAFPLDVPPRFDPDRFFVKVYEPDGEIHIPPVL